MENSIVISRCTVTSLHPVFFTRLHYIHSEHKRTLGAALKITNIEGWQIEEEKVRSWFLKTKRRC